jgi:membrane protease YdiL (CAAX protease family)
VSCQEVNLVHLAPYLAILTFLLAYSLAINPLRFSWGLRRGLAGVAFEPLPAELVGKAERIDRYTLVLRSALAISFISILMYWQSIPAAQVGLRSYDWKTNVAIGFAAGLLRVVLVSALAIFVPAASQNPITDYMRKGSLFFWVPFTLMGAFAEEFWIAICLVTLMAVGYSVEVSVGVTAIAFGAMHFRLRYWAALAVALTGVFSCLIFVWTRSLIATYLFHFVGNLGSLYWKRRGEIIPC